jgi:hypothetical protein
MSVSCRIATREIILTKTDKVMLLFGDNGKRTTRNEKLCIVSGSRDF